MTDTFIPPSPVTIWSVDAPPIGTGYAGLPVIAADGILFSPGIPIECAQVQCWASCGADDVGEGEISVQLSHDGSTWADVGSGANFIAGIPTGVVMVASEGYAFARVRIASTFGAVFYKLQATLQAVPGLFSSTGETGAGGITRITSDDDTVGITSPTGPTTDLSVGGVKRITSTGGSLVVTDPTGPTTNLEVALGTSALNTESGDLAANYDVTNALATFLTTADLAIGDWLVTFKAGVGFDATDAILEITTVEGTATATFEGTISSEFDNNADLAILGDLGFTFLAHVTAPGTLEFQAKMSAVSTPGDVTLIANTPTSTYAKTTGYTAVQVDPIPIGTSGQTRVVTFPFAFNTPGLDAGVVAATIQPGESLLGVYLSNPALWDGNSPFATVGPAPVSTAANWANNQMDTTIDNASGTFAPFVTFSDLETDTDVTENFVPPAGPPAPIYVSVIEGAETVTADAAPPSLPLTVTTGVNDTFNWSGNPTTVAPGTYTTVADLATAMATPLGGVGSDTGGKVTITIPDQSGQVGGTITTGATDILADAGFTSGQVIALVGGSPGSTHGTGTVIVHILKAF